MGTIMPTPTQVTTIQDLTDFINTHPDVGTIDIRDLIDGDMEVTESGKLKLAISLPANIILDEPDLSSVIHGNWKAVPVLLFVHPNNVRNSDGSIITHDLSTD